MKYRADIDGLRALAVVPVVLAHAHFAPFAGGFVGVDVFFVISGFLITSILVNEARQGRFSLVAFYERRARRIFPALFAVLCFAGLAAYLSFPAEEFAAFGRGVLATTFFVSNVLFWRETGYFDVAAESRPLLHTWSLAVEEQFYVLFPIAVWLTWRYLHGRFTLWLWPAFAGSFALSVWWVEAHPVAAFYLAPTRAWELLLGSVLALGLVPPPSTRLLREVMAGLGFTSIGLSVFTFTDQTPFPGVNALLPCLGAGLIIQAGRAGPSLVGRILSLRPVVFVGLISYSLYLWHWPLLVFARHWSPEPLTLPIALGVIALSFALATLSWRFVERPFRRSKSAIPGALVFTRRSIFSGSAIAGATCALFGLGIVASSGLPGRFPGVESLIEGPALEGVEGLDRCDARTQSLAEIRERCRFGASDGEPGIVVWGDSHAAAWLPFFRRFAAEQGVGGILLSATGCPSLAGAFRLDDRNGRNQCDPELAAGLLARIEEIQPRAVFLVSRWSLYNHGWITKGVLHGANHFLSDSEQTSRAAGDSQQVFARALDRTVTTLRERGIAVVILKAVPLLADSPSELYWSELRGRRVETGRAEHQAWQRLANDRIDGQALRDGVFALDPTDVFCESRCRYRDETGFFYRDDNHPSRYGSTILYAGLRGDLDRMWARISE